MTRLLFLFPLLFLTILPAAAGAQDLAPPEPIDAADWSVPDLAEPSPAGESAGEPAGGFALPDLTDRENFAPALQVLVLLTVLSLAPALLVLCTSFTRIIVVLSLLRQAMGTPTLPPNQVMTGLALFMTFCVMGPTWQRVSAEAVGPYLDGGITQQEALDRGVVPLREFMIAQIDAAENWSTIYTFQQFSGAEPPETWGEVSTFTLIPAFVLSELKVGFLMGFKVYLPFLVIDMVISAVLISMGMMMLPPVLISLPFKLLLFVLVDGWNLIAASLMGSFAVSGVAGVAAVSTGGGP